MFPPDVIVVREVPWREEKGRAVILAPRFSETFFGRLQRRFFGDSTVKVRLDDLGTFVWKLFDGTTSIAGITASMEEAYGDQAEAAGDRLDLFLRELHRNGWVSCLQKTMEESTLESPDGSGGVKEEN
jgi:hypothetical protein